MVSKFVILMTQGKMFTFLFVFVDPQHNVCVWENTRYGDDRKSTLQSLALLILWVSIFNVQHDYSDGVWTTTFLGASVLSEANSRYTGRVRIPASINTPEPQTLVYDNCILLITPSISGESNKRINTNR
jgi:hypothetical protein